ncbi:MAG: hypothetical protein K2N84_00630, partial [Clostridia bacterium]|nr:hypothetical protein [Clostridia bacterium]
MLTPLTAPVIALDGNIVEWEDVENAAYYEVTINGTSVKAIGGFYVINVTESGNYEVTVKAVPATNSAYSESASSNKVVYTYTKPEQPIKPEKPVQLTAPIFK